MFFFVKIFSSFAFPAAARAEEKDGGIRGRRLVDVCSNHYSRMLPHLLLASWNGPNVGDPVRAGPFSQCVVGRSQSLESLTAGMEYKRP